MVRDRGQRDRSVGVVVVAAATAAVDVLRFVAVVVAVAACSVLVVSLRSQHLFRIRPFLVLTPHPKRAFGENVHAEHEFSAIRSNDLS